MCQCTPEIRTPFCGKPGCEWPATEWPTTPPFYSFQLPNGETVERISVVDQTGKEVLSVTATGLVDLEHRYTRLHVAHDSLMLRAGRLENKIKRLMAALADEVTA
jgi:hypothetical protein